jgi:hypothetical protein
MEVTLMSFIDATRQNFTQLPAQNYAKDGRLYFDLPKAGLLSRLFVTVVGTMTVTPGTGTAVLSERRAFNLIKRVRLIANSGASIFDVSGYGTYLINTLLRKDATPNDSFIDEGYKAEIYSAGVASGANAWKFGLEIPIAINERDPIGLILLQNNATQLTLEIEFNPEFGVNGVIAPVVVTGNAVSSFAGKVDVMMEYFTVPRNKEDYPSLNVIHQWLEQQDAIASAGAWAKSLLRGNTYMRMIHYVTLNNLLDTANVEKLRVLYNQSEVPYIINKLPQLFIQRARYGRDLPKGTFVHDWYMSSGQVSLGTSRDFINSANVTEFQSEITLASGASVPAGTSFINTITEQLIKIG